MKIHIRHGDIHLIHLRTRLPFKYGIATMTDVPQAFVRLWVEVGGKPVQESPPICCRPNGSPKTRPSRLPRKWLRCFQVIQNAVTLATGLEERLPLIFGANCMRHRQTGVPVSICPRC